MSSDVSIRVERVSKCYQIYDQPRDRLKQFLLPRLSHMVGRPVRQYFREFWALNDVSFEVPRGETVGVIGRNGSGKSTLLQIVCGTLTPTSGQVHTAGRIGALLELGSGFNPEFTGRENVYLNAAVLGLTTDEIDARFDDIVSFADIGDFIDQPVKTYSSGMMVRLAFAVQAQISPDVLIVDEALAVGDARFQAKCFERLKQLKDEGTSILLVTHSNEQIVTHCSRAVLLDGGRIVEQGEPRRVVNRYLDLLFGRSVTAPAQGEGGETHATLPEDGGAADAATNSPEAVTPEANLVVESSRQLFDDAFHTRPGYNPHEYRWGDGAASIQDFFLAADGEAYPSAIVSGQRLLLEFGVCFNRMVVRPIFGITVKTKEGVTVYGVNSESLEIPVCESLGRAGSRTVVRAQLHCRLAPGDYFVSLGVASVQGGDVVPLDRRYDAIHLQVLPVNGFFGLVDMGMNMEIKEIQ